MPAGTTSLRDRCPAMSCSPDFVAEADFGAIGPIWLSSARVLLQRDVLSWGLLWAISVRRNATAGVTTLVEEAASILAEDERCPMRRVLGGPPVCARARVDPKLGLILQALTVCVERANETLVFGVPCEASRI